MWKGRASRRLRPRVKYVNKSGRASKFEHTSIQLRGSKTFETSSATREREAKTDSNLFSTRSPKKKPNDKMQNIKYCCLFLLVLIVATEFTSAAPAYNDYENSIRDLYELLLQKEAIEERIGAHQVARKSGRSPSLRLRFGRRSDPSLIQASPYMLAAAQDAAEIAN